MSLLRKGLLVIALPFLYQAILLGMLLNRQQAHTLAQQWAVHTKEVLLEMDRMAAWLLQHQSNLRGYLLTGETSHKDRARVAAVELQNTEKRLLVQVSDRREQRDRMADVHNLLEARIAWNEEILGLVDAGMKEEALRRVRSGRGEQLMQSLRTQLEAMRGTEEQLDRERLRQLRETTAEQNGILAAGMVVNVLVGALTMLLFSRGISSRIEVLTANLYRLARGEPLVPPVGGSDEISELDRGFHAMASNLAAAQEMERKSQLMLQEQNSELSRANNELDHKNQENEMFVYSVSHDLRSPLVNLQGFSKELGLVRDELRKLLNGELSTADRERARTLVDRDIAEAIHYIQTAVTRLAAIIDALLRLSRIGRIEYLPETVDVQAVVKRVVEAMKRTIDERGATVTVKPLPPAWGDATAIEQIFANLLANAINYLDPKRPGLVEIGFVEEPVPKAEGMQVYYVRDNGVGIPEVLQPKIFGVFQRLHPELAPGEGIGLPLVRRVAQRHGGDVWVESVDGKGSTFYVAIASKEHSPLVFAPRKERIRLTARVL